MSNWVDVQLDVLAASPEEIRQIEQALRNPCDELIHRRAQRDGVTPESIAATVKSNVSFKPVPNLGHSDASLQTARRSESSWKDRFCGLVWSHLHLVSRDHPRALFLAQYWDDCMSYGRKIVIHAGEQIRSSYDGDHHAQGIEWVLPNISASYLSEYALGLKVGSLWDKWQEDLAKEVFGLKFWYGKRTFENVICLVMSEK